MAFALAHLPSDVTPDFAMILLKGSTKTILNLILGHHHPLGLNRALAHLGPKVLAGESYRNLAALLTDRPTAKFLHHRQSIDEKMIGGLSTLPADLRPSSLHSTNRLLSSIDMGWWVQLGQDGNSSEGETSLVRRSRLKKGLLPPSPG